MRKILLLLLSVTLVLASCKKYSFDEEDLLPHLDSSRQNVIVAATTDLDFSKKIISNTALLAPAYRSLIVGMPNWESLNWKTENFKGVDVMYGTPFYNSKADRASIAIMNYYKSKLYSKATDVVFRGYEATMYLTSRGLTNDLICDLD